MKLIIDIPDGIYEQIKRTYRKKRGSVPYCYIAWGTPIKEIETKIQDERDSFKISPNTLNAKLEVLKLIDNL